MIVLNAVALEYWKPSLGVTVTQIVLGLFFPLSMSIPILIVGLLQYLVISRRWKIEESEDSGVFFDSDLITGEALTGILVAFTAVLAMGIPFTGILDKKAD